MYIPLIANIQASALVSLFVSKFCHVKFTIEFTFCLHFGNVDNDITSFWPVFSHHMSANCFFPRGIINCKLLNCVRRTCVNHK